MDLPKLLHTILLRSPLNLFDEFLVECQKHYESPAHTFVEMRTRDNKKVRGDIFEEFCVLYLKHVKGYSQVWRLEDVPDDVLATLALKRPDVGIDIICEKGGKYTAVQCKYKKHVSHKKNVVTWKQLSTFYALVLRTGPWEKFIVMTNCDYTRHMGRKTAKDLSICLKRFQSTTKEQWTKMCEIEGVPLAGPLAAGAGPAAGPPRLSVEDLRAARLARFTKAGE